MNQYTQQEHQAAMQVQHMATMHAQHYAQPQDYEAATIALLIEALILAGGASFLNPTEENE